eukprot:3160822-Amphidinium_carterae.1
MAAGSALESGQNIFHEILLLQTQRAMQAGGLDCGTSNSVSLRDHSCNHTSLSLQEKSIQIPYSKHCSVTLACFVIPKHVQTIRLSYYFCAWLSVFQGEGLRSA